MVVTVRQVQRGVPTKACDAGNGATSPQRDVPTEACCEL